MFLVPGNIVGIAIACIVIYVIYKLKKKLDYFTDRNMPYVKMKPIDLVKTMSLGNMAERPLVLYEKHKGSESPYIGYFTFFNPAILVLDPTMVQDILIKDFSHFHDHGFDIDFKKDPLAGHLFNMKGDQWRTLRHKLVPTFTSGKLRGMVPIMEECADSLVHDIMRDPSLQKDTNLKDLFKIYSLAVIVKCAFGIDPESIKDANSEFKRVMTKILTPSTLTIMKIVLMSLFPFLKFKFFPKDVEDFFISLTKDTFEMRQKSGVKRNDFVQLLLELREKGSVQVDSKDLEQDEKETLEKINSETTSEKLELTDDLLAAQAFVFLVGGYENSAYLAAITMYVLSKHPEIQEQVRREVNEVKEKHGSLSYQAMRDMKLLGATVDEALRLYSAVPTLLRGCTKPYTLSDGNKIDKGTMMILPVKGFHYDPKFWTDPEIFYPERFLGDQEIQSGTYLPFGDGPRICIAQRLALVTTKMVIAKLLTKFTLLPSSKTKEPAKVSFTTSSDFDGGVWGTLEPLS